MRLLVTRPKGDAEETASKLVARGHEPVLAPMLEIRLRAGPEISLANVRAVLATSANGVRAFAARSRRRDILLLTVGEKSTHVGLEFGFTNVRHADGDAEALANLAIADLSPGDGLLLHAAGSETRGDLAGRLERAGFTVRADVLYEAIAASALPAIARDALSNQRIDGVLFFSPRTAGIFVNLADRAELRDACARLRAYCISQATAAALHGFSFRSIHIAARPNEDALLALLDEEA